MQKPLPPRSAAKRTAMLDAAQACFLEKGYANTSVDEVACRAGVSKATIYAHFSNKDDLFGAIICRRCDDQAERWLTRPQLPESHDTRTILRSMAQQLLEMFLSPEVMGIYRMVIAEAPRHPELARAFYEAGPVRGKLRMAEIFEEMKARGQLSFDNAWRTVDLFIGMLRGECFNRALMGLPAAATATPEDTVEAVVDIMMRAYVTQQ